MKTGPAFLLAQLGAHAASKFAERLEAIGLVPAHAGVLRILATTPGLTQQALASALSAQPSRLVGLVDELEERGLVERRSDENDRRRHALHLTEKGKSMMQALERVAREHRKSLLAALSEEEQDRLADLLQRVADQQGLIRRVHPGFSRKQKR